MTFIDTDVIRVLEETLPRRFGGEPRITSWLRRRRPTTAPAYGCWWRRRSRRSTPERGPKRS
jgi:hypothetical protein